MLYSGILPLSLLRINHVESMSRHQKIHDGLRPFLDMCVNFSTLSFLQKHNGSFLLCKGSTPFVANLWIMEVRRTFASLIFRHGKRFEWKANFLAQAKEEEKREWIRDIEWCNAMFTSRTFFFYIEYFGGCYPCRLRYRIIRILITITFFFCYIFCSCKAITYSSSSSDSH